MKKQTLFTLVVLVVLLSIAVLGVSTARADDVTNTNAIAGTWNGNMHLSVTNSVQRIKLVIPAGCEPGYVCGTLLNYAVQCNWEITYDGFSAGAYQYHFSNTLKGGCPAGSAGSLTLMSDGTLYRVHQTPQFTATGALSQLPNQ
jgi:carbohydrate-binding DOMON domain-containing protein